MDTVKTRRRKGPLPYPGLPSTFFAYVRPGVGDECWWWAGFIDQNGSARHYHAGRLYRAQRLALEMVTGRPVPYDRVIQTSCDSRSCCNPDHLWAVPRIELSRLQRADPPARRGAPAPQLGITG